MSFANTCLDAWVCAALCQESRGWSAFRVRVPSVSPSAASSFLEELVDFGRGEIMKAQVILPEQSKRLGKEGFAELCIPGG